MVTVATEESRRKKKKKKKKRESLRRRGGQWEQGLRNVLPLERGNTMG